jgi:hypothetical protein
MARTSTARQQAPVTSEEPEPLSFEAMRAAAEVYWPGLGGKVADQWREWNRDLFDGALRPAPLVLSRMGAALGHWFPTLDPSADQRLGFEEKLLVQSIGYMPPRRITSVRRADLLRGMMARLRTQDGLPPLKSNSDEGCALLMELHRRLTGERVWMAPEREEKTLQEDLGGGLYKPSEVFVVQDDDPETGAPSLSRDKIRGWPGTLMDLGHIARD